MKTGAALAVVGIWIACQVLKGGALNKILATSTTPAGTGPTSPDYATNPASNPYTPTGGYPVNTVPGGTVEFQNGYWQTNNLPTQMYTAPAGPPA